MGMRRVRWSGSHYFSFLLSVSFRLSILFLPVSYTLFGATLHLARFIAALDMVEGRIGGENGYLRLILVETRKCQFSRSLVFFNHF